MERIDRDTRQLIERGVAALEKLAEDPQIEIEAGPPICPHCNTFNPEVATRDEEMSGPLHEFLLVVTCLNCHNRFYAIPLTWHCVKTHSEAEEEMRMRDERVNGN